LLFFGKTQVFHLIQVTSFWRWKIQSWIFPRLRVRWAIFSWKYETLTLFYEFDCVFAN